MPEQRSDAKPRVALVFGDAAAAARVRAALAERVDVAYAAPAAGFDMADVLAAHATVALVLLDGSDWLDRVTADLATAGIAVVFDDPEISGQLQDWEKARWLRHLVAKLAGNHEYDPPRPQGNVGGTAAEVGVEPVLPSLQDSAVPDAVDPLQAAPAPDGSSAVVPFAIEPAESLDIDTEALSKMIDERLAELNAAESGAAAGRDVGTEPELVSSAELAMEPDGGVPADSRGAAMDATAAGTAAKDDSVAATLTAAVAGWELVDPTVPSAPSAKPVSNGVQAPPGLGELDGLELVPMEAPAVEHHAAPVERWMHVETRKAATGEGQPAAADGAGEHAR